MAETVGTKDLKITGNGQTSGGVFHNVHVTGEGIVNGDLACQQMKVVGTLESRASVQARTLRVVGTLDVHGDLEAEEVNVTGAITLKGACNAERLVLKKLDWWSTTNSSRERAA